MEYMPFINFAVESVRYWDHLRFGDYLRACTDSLLLIFQTFFPSYNHYSLGDGYHCSANQTCMTPREGPIPVSTVAPRCNTNDNVLRYSCCPMDRVLRIHCRVFRFMDRVTGLHFSSPIPSPAVV